MIFCVFNLADDNFLLCPLERFAALALGFAVRIVLE